MNLQIKTKSIEREEKINKLFTGLGSARIVKNCDLGLENTVRTSQPANNRYVLLALALVLV